MPEPKPKFQPSANLLELGADAARAQAKKFAADTPEPALNQVASADAAVAVEKTPDVTPPERLNFDAIKQMIVSQIGDKAEVKHLEVKVVSEGAKLSAEIYAGLIGGKILIEGLIVNDSNELALRDLKVDARGFVKSQIESSLSDFAPTIKKYFETQYKNKVSSIQIVGPDLVIGFESLLTTPPSSKAEPAPKQTISPDASATVEPVPKTEDVTVPKKLKGRRRQSRGADKVPSQKSGEAADYRTVQQIFNAMQDGDELAFTEGDSNDRRVVRKVGDNKYGVIYKGTTDESMNRDDLIGLIGTKIWKFDPTYKKPELQASSVPGSDPAHNIAERIEALPSDERKRNSEVLRLLLATESPRVAMAILEGMDLIRDGLNAAALNFFQGDEKELAKHQKQVAEHIRVEVHNFLYAQGLKGNKENDILELYLEKDVAMGKEGDEQKKEQTGVRTEMAVEVFEDKGEDAYFLMPEKSAFGVFDGVSSASKAKEGADLAAQRAKIMFVSQEFEGKSAKDVELLMRNHLLQIHKELCDLEKGDDKYITTASIAHVHEDANGERKLIVGNVGDSRVYIFHNGKLEQVTLDDGGVRSLVKDDGDEINAREAQSILNNTVSSQDLTDGQRKLFSNRNKVNQILGYDSGRKFEPRMYTSDIASGDIVFASSDGVHDPLTDNEMEGILQKNEGKAPSEIAKAFIEAVKKRNEDWHHLRSKTDDVTIVIVRVE